MSVRATNGVPIAPEGFASTTLARVAGGGRGAAGASSAGRLAVLSGCTSPSESIGGPGVAAT
jgi:hypothetical protein